MIKALDEVMADYEFVNIIKEKYPKESEIDIKQAFESFDNYCVFIADDLSDFVFSFNHEIVLAKNIRDVEDGKFTEEQLKHYVAVTAFRAYNSISTNLTEGLTSKSKLIKEGNPMFGVKDYVFTDSFYSYMEELQDEAMDSYIDFVGEDNIIYPFSFDEIPKDFSSKAMDLYNRYMDEIYDVLEMHCDDFHGMGGKLIHEDYWIKHCEEEIKESQDMFEEIPFWVVVDVEKTTERMKTKHNYKSITIDGETWYYKTEY